MNEKIFKAYDVRGIYPEEINEEAVKTIAKSYAQFLSQSQASSPQSPMKIAVGRDVRLSSPALQAAVIEGLTEMGVDVIDIGCGPTEMIYFAVGAHNLDGAIQVSASHNPAEYNGLKMIKAHVEALSGDSGLPEVKELATQNNFDAAETPGQVTEQDLTGEYLAFLKKLVGDIQLPKLKIVANNNFGMSGVLAVKLLQEIAPQITMIGLNDTPDGSFPKGRPDPSLPENEREIAELVRQEKADLGVAWDADGDRCFILDENGQLVEPPYLIGLLAQNLLAKNPGEKVIYDPRNAWAVGETITEAGGQALLDKAGHAFIKNRMRQENALFAGETSGHFYFRDFFFADNGLIPFLLVLEMIAHSGQKVSQLVAPLRNKYHVSGEKNFKVADVAAKIDQVRQNYSSGQLDETDGISIDMGEWRFNLRASNTEPLLRLNVEGRSSEIVEQKTAELTNLLEN